MNVLKQSMAVHKTVLTLMDYTLAAVILDTVLAVMDIPAMVLDTLMHCAPTCLDSFTYYYYTDINECREGTHLCNQTCTNTNGSYICQCQEGFRLDNDGMECNGRFMFTAIMLILDNTMVLMVLLT